MAVAVESSGPKFNAWVMLVLGVIVGMISYLLFYYAKADSLPETPATELQISQLGLSGTGVFGVETEVTDPGATEDGLTASFTYDWNLYNTASLDKSVSMGAYVENHTSGTKRTYVRFGAYPSITKASACFTSTDGAIGGTALKTVDVPGNNRTFVTGGSYIPIPGAPVVIAACIVPVNTSGTIAVPGNTSTGLVTLTFPTVLAAKPTNPARPSTSPVWVFNARNLTGAWDGFGTTGYVWRPCPAGYTTAEDGAKYTCVPNPGVTQPHAFLIPFIETAYAAPQDRDCENRADDEGDGLIDWNGTSTAPADDGCSGPSDNNEKTPARPTCNGNSC